MLIPGFNKSLNHIFFSLYINYIIIACYYLLISGYYSFKTLSLNFKKNMNKMEKIFFLIFAYLIDIFQVNTLNIIIFYDNINIINLICIYNFIFKNI
jgi:hypothetical protein